MRVSLRWLRDYVEFPQSGEEIARLLTMSGTEVTTILRIGTEWENIVIGRVVDIGRHENADNLYVARVDVGSETLTLVTAAPNLRTGAVVPVVRAGGRLSADRVLEARRFRGVLSQGMMCSGDELGVSADKDHIYTLESSAPVGASAREVLGDEILDIELTPNRPDCLGMIGIAREVAALTGGSLRLPPIELPPGAVSIDERVRIFVDDPDLCPRYTATYLEGAKIGPSPAWMQRRLHAAGVRAINNVVDVTNYVMLELGQPLHAFDADRLQDGTIRVRRARPGERLTTIDGVDRDLPADALVIADTTTAVGLAGIMGGSNSEISATTTRIVLESATFDRTGIRRTSKALRLSTEASKRFDKGLDRELAPMGAQRALSLMVQLAGGSPARGLIDVAQPAPPPRTLRFMVGELAALIGQTYTVEEVHQVLDPLGFQPAHQGETFDVVIPSWRTDVEGRADIAEEVARIRGYDAIPVALPAGRLPPAYEDPALRWEEAIRSALAAAGLQEVKTYSLIDPQALARLDAGWTLTRSPDPEMVAVYNPMSVEQSRLRTTLLPSLLSTVAANLRFQERVLIFEVARVYLPPLDPLPREERRLGLALAGRRSPHGWNTDASAIDFYDLKGAIEAAFRAVRRPAPTFEPGSAPWAHPGRAAAVLPEAGATALGVAGQVHPRVAERYDMENVAVYAAELDLDRLVALACEEVRVQPLPRYPGVTRDVALLLGDQVTHDQIAGVLREAGGALLEHLELFDVYRGEPVPAGHRSLAYSLTFRSPARTLTEEDVAEAMQRIERAVIERFGAQIRGK